MSERMFTAIGAISGTSMDGIDVALVRTDGASRVETGAGRMLPYPAELRRDLLKLLEDPSIAERDPLDVIERRVTEAFGNAIRQFMQQAGIAASSVDLVGLHGQTIWHRPERRFTRQLGRGDLLAGMLKIGVVDAFRQADVKAGGHGAPLAPLYHAALAADLAKPLMVLNWGGVGNVTWIGRDGAVIAFDTGPASALMDDLMRSRFGLPYDAGGRIAAEGRIDGAMLARLMENPFFEALPPKSLDRQDFHARAAAVEELEGHDAAAAYRRDGDRTSSITGYRTLARDGRDLALGTATPSSQDETLSLHRLATSKGAIAVNLFAEIVGRAAFHDALKAFLGVHSGKATTWREFSESLAARFGEPARRFFRQWFERPGAPTFEVKWQETATGVDVIVQQTLPPYELGLPIDFVGGEGVRRVVVDASIETTRVHIGQIAGVTQLDVDPEATIPTAGITVVPIRSSRSRRRDR